MEKRNSGRGRKGFTLTEITIVVAIFAIMAAVALPFLQGFLVDLEMARLNNAAKQIYLAAQNRMVSMRSAGTLANYVTGDENLQPITIGTQSMVFADEKMSVMQSYILPVGTITDAVRVEDKGHYVVVFDEEHGLLQEVYFAEAPLSDGDTVSADTLSGWRSDTAARRSRRVGFYNGTGDAANRVVRLQQVKLELLNQEELTAKITLSDSPGLSLDKLFIKLRVENADDSTQVVEWALGLNRPDFDWVVNGTPQMYGKVLDNLNKPFSTIFSDSAGNPLITPGANLKVSAVLSVKPEVDTGGVTYRDSEPAIQTVNSLFHSVHIQKVSASGGGAEKNYLSLEVAWGRHISNLNLVTDPKSMIPGVDQNLFFANQTRIIYFHAEQDTSGWNSVYGNRASPMVNNPKLLIYDGGEKELVGITRPLFEHFGAPEGVVSTDEYKLRNVKIISPVINYAVSQAYKYYGTLASYANTTQIVNCHVSGFRGQSRVKVDGVTLAGGLVGFAFGTSIINSSVSIPEMEVKVISQSVNLGAASAAQVGGMVGQSYEPRDNKTVLMSGCFVDIGELRVEGGSVGMLMGNNWQGTTLDTCYAVGKITGTAIQAGGLFGTDITKVAIGLQHIYDCYALVDLREVNVRNARKFAALPGFREGIEVENVYFVKEVTGDALVDGAGKSTEITLEQLKAGSDADGKLFFNENSKWTTGGVQAQTFTASPWYNGIYPYPAIMGITHRGDWPE